MHPRRPEGIDRTSAAHWAIVLIVATLACNGAAKAWGQQAAVEGKHVTGRRWALLIGVDQYKRLVTLNYCGNDVRAMGERLVQLGFDPEQVVVLHNQAESLDFQPLKGNIEDRTKLVLGSARKGDLVLLSFSGRGCEETSSIFRWSST